MLKTGIHNILHVKSKDQGPVSQKFVRTIYALRIRRASVKL